MIVPSRKADLYQAISMLNELPARVGEDFLAPLIQDIGWPFKCIKDNLLDTDWHRILYPLTLEQFAQLKWCRKKFLLDKDMLHPVSKDDIHLIIRNQIENVWTAIGRDSEYCRQSTAWHKRSILSARRFCAPVTLAFTADGLKILDGNHRVAALFDTGLCKTVEIDAWIGFNEIQA